MRLKWLDMERIHQIFMFHGGSVLSVGISQEMGWWYIARNRI